MKDKLHCLCLHVCWWIFVKYPTGVYGTVSDPCSPNLNKIKVADMCKASFAAEYVADDGNENFDSVLMRVMIQDDNCTCHVTVDHITSSVVTYIKTIFAPNENACGLEIDITKQPLPTISCTSGHSDSSYTFERNDVLTFTSRTILGNFTTGYCIQISRAYNNDNNAVLKIDCGEPGIYEIPSPPPTETTASKTSPFYMNNQTKLNVDKKEETGMTYIAVGVSSGLCIILIAVVVIIICQRKRSSHTNKEIKDEPNNTDNNSQHHDSNNLDYDGLQYNVLYITAEQQDKVDVNYAAVDLDGQISGIQTSEKGGNYNASDVGCTSTENTNHANDHKGKPFKSLSTNQNEIGNDKQGGSRDVYDVVNKRTISSTDDRNPTYAVVDKSRKSRNP